MRIAQVGGKVDKVFRNARNADATLAGTMAAGTPVVLALNGTDDGLAVVLPSTAGAALTQAATFGVLSQALPYLYTTDLCIASGVIVNAILTFATRAASGNSWTSSQSMASWLALTVDTVNNAFVSYSASGGQSQYQPYAILAQSISSIAASASATTDTRTAITLSVKVFVNML